MTDFTPKRVIEREVYSVDYATCGELAPGETIESAVWSNSVRIGVDPNPDDMLIGVAIINGTVVSQIIAGGLPDVQYWPICTATTSEGQVLVLPDPGQGALHVVP